MRVLRLVMGLALVSLVFTQCKKDNLLDELPSDDPALKSAPNGMFTVTVKNVSKNYDYFSGGAEFGVSGGDMTPPANPGETITVHFHAGRNHKLSFGSMYGASNDWFYAPNGGGIQLFSGDPAVALEGDITDMIHLWDAGTEVDGSGSPGTPEHEHVALETGAASMEDNIQVSLDYDGVSMFTLTINVLAGSETPLSPVAWVVHSNGQHPIFTEGTFDYGNGLEDLAEMGNAAPLGDYLKMHSGYVSPVAPILWVLHDKKDNPIFTEGTPDYGKGLETLAETGNPGPLHASLMSAGYVTGVQAIPEGGGSAAPIFPGEKYVFTIDGQVGQSLSITSMLGASNDEFFSTGEEGIKLSNGMDEKDITHFFEIYDAGTEVNEYPGAGYHQGGPEGPDEMGNVRLLNDEFKWPNASQVIKVTIKKN